MTNETTAAPKRIPELDGLRGFAIFIVVLGHYLTVSTPPLAGRILQGIVALSWTGVDLFFVLSGFLIGGILLEARGADNYFRVFYVRRFFRIFPIYYVWLILYVLLLSLGGSFLRAHVASGTLPTLGFETWGHFLFLQNFMAPGYIPIADWCLGVTWSLAVEEQFYLIAPLAVNFLNRKTLTRTLIALVVAAPLLRLFVHNGFVHGPDLAYTLTICRADALAIGVLAAIAVRDARFKKLILESRRPIEIGAAVLAIGMIGMWALAPNPRALPAQSLGYTWIAFFYAGILLLAISFPTGVVSMLARRSWLRELGRVSYCIYIIHRPVQLALFMAIKRRPPELFNFADIALTIAAMAITYGIARASWKFFEHPLVQIGHHASYSTRLEVRMPELALDRNS